jgi:2-polyprenyl-3-methyl-5-hydroxy-6-metoxy-1,4-benzoquinol methylase
MPSRYEVAVDRDAANNPHAYMLQMVGWNRKVLELGAAAGHITRALAEQGCRVTAIEYDPGAAGDLKEIADEVIVGDLNDPHVFSELSSEFDVVLAGDVLEHLLFPQQVLSRAAQLLVHGGRVVVSVPNVGHVDVRLSLLQGRFDYQTLGLLDDTHIRFFTLKTIKDLVKKSGLVMTDLQRVRVPAFETELGVERSTVPDVVLNVALSDPEAETYQFVFSAIKDDGDYLTARLAEHNIELQDEMSRAVIAMRAAETSYESARLDEISKADEMREALDKIRGELDGEHLLRLLAESEIAALTQTKTFRYTNLLRRCYSRLRGAGG